jgi:hypothetical protein
MADWCADIVEQVGNWLSAPVLRPIIPHLHHAPDIVISVGERKGGMTRKGEAFRQGGDTAFQHRSVMGDASHHREDVLRDIAMILDRNRRNQIFPVKDLKRLKRLRVKLEKLGEDEPQTRTLIFQLKSIEISDGHMAYSGNQALTTCNQIIEAESLDRRPCFQSGDLARFRNAEDSDPQKLSDGLQHVLDGLRVSATSSTIARAINP